MVITKDLSQAACHRSGILDEDEGKPTIWIHWFTDYVLKLCLGVTFQVGREDLELCF